MDRIASVSFACSAEGICVGEEVRVVGSLSQLGAWNPDCGVALVADVIDFPKVPAFKTINSISLPFDAELEYKYVIINPSGVRWESFGFNRRLTVSHDNMAVEDEFDISNSKIRIFAEPSSLGHETAQFDSGTHWPDFKEELKADDPLILVSMNLPWSVKRAPPGSSEKWIFKRFKGLWVPVLYNVAASTNINFTWIGYPQIDLEDPQEQEEVSEILQRKYNCLPLFIPKPTLDLHRKFCNGVLFPLFHNILETSFESTPVYSEELWQSYRTVNSLFANKIKEIFSTNESNEMIWIHDFQLLLVPGFISHHRPTSNIGIFLHIPFPSSEIYKVLKHREELLLSMICCDLIGFHLFEYARHFITSCKRILGVDYACIKGGFLGLKFYGRNVLLKVGQLGIETRFMQETFQLPKFLNTSQVIKDKYSSVRRYALGVDPLHRLSGISNKFKAFANFVSTRQSNKYTRLSLVQMLFYPRNSSHKEAEFCLKEITDLANSINQKVGREIIELISYDEMNKGMRFAYMMHAQCLVNTSLRDGLSLVPLEFIATKDTLPARIILSEFAGVSRALSSPLRVNPYDVRPT